MGAKFHSEVHQREEVTYLKLSGVIDEDNELGTLADQIAAGTVVIDLSEIERINSCGVRDWVNWLGRVEKQGAHAVLVECSPSIVAQVNLVNNFTGGGVVKSFYAPYFCPSCDREKVLLIETRDAAGQGTFHAPTCRCDECDGPMDFDDMEDSYFAFLANSAKIATDKRVDDVITEFTPSETGPKLRARTSPGLTPAGSTHSHTLTPPPVSSLPSVPSLPSLPAARRDAAYAALTTGKHLLPSQAEVAAGSSNHQSGHSGANPRVTPAMPLPAMPTVQIQSAPMSEPSGSRVWMVIVGVLLVGALALVAYLFLGGPPHPASASGPPPTAGATR